MRQALVIGCDGQIGSYLVEILLEKGYTVYGISRGTGGGEVTYLDNFDEFIEGEIYNMAGQTNSTISFNQPEETFRDNTELVAKLCLHVKKYPNLKYFQANSAEIFKGNGICGHFEKNLSEGNLKDLHPANPYGVSKIAAYHLIDLYRKKFELFMVSGIIFNAESIRRKAGFLTPKVISAVKTGSELRLGNIESRRDWIHAYDVAMAAWHSLQHSIPQDYIISLGEVNSVKTFVEMAYQIKEERIEWKNGCGLIDGEIRIILDLSLYQKEENWFCGINTKLRSIGWKPKYQNLSEIIKSLIL